ncbi:hypothetical protein BDZ97DRAFT_1883057 [Flammula alnicola]|nr:hypothetical protein BDZ97DRAFT_1883057 [Flammula alnicola]
MRGAGKEKAAEPSDTDESLPVQDDLTEYLDSTLDNFARKRTRKKSTSSSSSYGTPSSTHSRASGSSASGSNFYYPGANLNNKDSEDFPYAYPSVAPPHYQMDVDVPSPRRGSRDPELRRSRKAAEMSMPIPKDPEDFPFLYPSVASNNQTDVDVLSPERSSPDPELSRSPEDASSQGGGEGQTSSSGRWKPVGMSMPIPDKPVGSSRMGYPCTVPGCWEHFEKMDDVIWHSRNIHGRNIPGCKPYPCHFDGCDRSFNLRSNLRRHNRVHTSSSSANFPT